MIGEVLHVSPFTRIRSHGNILQVNQKPTKAWNDFSYEQEKTNGLLMNRLEKIYTSNPHGGNTNVKGLIVAHVVS